MKPSKPKPVSKAGPKPDRRGIYRAEDWRESNPGYQYSPPRVSKCGRFVEIDGGSVYDTDQLGRKPS